MKPDTEGMKRIKKINRDARISYALRGEAGIGGGKEAMRRHPLPEGSKVLDIGFGDCELEEIALQKNCLVFGADIAEGSWRVAEKKELMKKGFVPFFLDVCHDRLPLPDNLVDFAYCLETAEHLSNPFFAFAEVKRVLKHKGRFILAFPMPESNLGYDGGKHAHVYPGFLQRAPFERFMMQLYFKKIERTENGDSAWYIFENIKEGDITDLFYVVSAPALSEQELYGWI